MGTITIVGLGPGDPRQLTLEAWEILQGAREVWLRTERHPTVEGLPPETRLHSFDSLYEEGEDFSQIYEAIATRVLELGRRAEGVVYAVPGHPLVGEATVERVVREARRTGVETRVVEGLSFVEPTLSALGVDALDGLQVFDAIELSRHHHPPLNPDLPTLVGQLYSRPLTGAVKLTLMNQYPDEHEVALVDAAGTEGERIVRLLLYRLDRRHEAAGLPTHLTTLYVPPLTEVSSFEGLQDTVARLRAPGGCPWDREQTHESLRAGLLEEAYESVAAIDRGDVEDLREELGDLLLQILLQTQIATEAGTFKMPEVIAGIDAKLKHRHPHVWGDVSVADTGEVLHNWEELKREEKAERESVLDGVPEALPALQQAHTYGQRVARVGFDWPDVSGVVAKVQEEMVELLSAPTVERQEAELGDLLFAVANWARWVGVDPETALRKANARFARRFVHLERTAAGRGVEIGALSIDELDVFWEEAKRRDNKEGTS
ncbi:MAG: nucleoside triphosphate pyrophosphohydrolase [Chloroflexota bacterium]|nr:nucleoside triphosphate pyrophosphohydrolase [Chloroflexota bacterium]